jgi:hypothetical protein
MNVQHIINNYRQNTVERIIFSTVFLFPLFGFSQAFLVKGKVVDSLDNPIPYASIFIEKSQIGTNSDIEGYFEISVDKLPVTIQTSSMGYKSRDIVVEDSKENVLIPLRPKSTYLEEVVITSNKPQSSVLVGCIKRRGMAGFYATKPFQQIALMVDNNENRLYSGNYLLKSLAIKISPLTYGATKADGSQQLRLRLYKLKEGKVKVGEDILHKGILITPNKNSWYKTEIPYKIQLPAKGFVLALEWIENQKFEDWKSENVYGLQLELSNLKDKERVYYSTWYFDPVKKRWGWQAEDEGKYTIPAFRIELSADE